MTPDKYIRVPDHVQLNEIARLYPALPLGIPLDDRGLNKSVTREVQGASGETIRVLFDETRIDFTLKSNPAVYLRTYLINEQIASIDLHPQVITETKVYEAIKEMKPDAFVALSLAYFEAYGHDITVIRSIWTENDPNTKTFLRAPKKMSKEEAVAQTRDGKIFATHGFSVFGIEPHPTNDSGDVWFVLLWRDNSKRFQFPPDSV